MKVNWAYLISFVIGLMAAVYARNWMLGVVVWATLSGCVGAANSISAMDKSDHHGSGF